MSRSAHTRRPPPTSRQAFHGGGQPCPTGVFAVNGGRLRGDRGAGCRNRRERRGVTGEHRGPREHACRSSGADAIGSGIRTPAHGTGEPVERAEKTDMTTTLCTLHRYRLGEGRDRPCERVGADAGDLCARTVAAVQQLATVAGSVRGQRLHHHRTRMARRPRHGPGGARGPECVRAQDGAGRHRPLSRGDQPSRPQAGGDRTFLRWADRPEDFRWGSCRSDRRHRQRALQGSSAATGFGAEVGVPGATQPGESEQGSDPDPRAVHLRLDEQPR